MIRSKAEFLTRGRKKKLTAGSGQQLSWWLVHAYPPTLLHDRWHLLLIGPTLSFSVNYRYGGVRLLRRRQDWILARAVQERAGS